MAATIHFFMPDAPYGWLCALSPHAIELDGLIWPTAEHYYQAQKFIFHPVVQELIRQEHDPFKAKAIARDYKERRDPDWKPQGQFQGKQPRCLAVFRYAMHAKFAQHADLAAELLATGDAGLVEDNPHDTFWGSGADGTGLNWCGRILMETRTRLSDKQASIL